MVYRQEIKCVNEVFLGPEGPVTFGYQACREAFCLWFEAEQPKTVEFMIVGTNYGAAPEGFRLVASTLLNDFYAYHLLKKERS